MLSELHGKHFSMSSSCTACLTCKWLNHMDERQHGQLSLRNCYSHHQFTHVAWLLQCYCNKRWFHTAYVTFNGTRVACPKPPRVMRNTFYLGKCCRKDENIHRLLFLITIYLLLGTVQGGRSWP